MLKTLTKYAPVIYILLLVVLVGCLPDLAWAAPDVKFTPLVDLPFVTENTANIGDYVNGLYWLSITAASLLVVVKIIGAGAGYVMSDVVTSKEQAKKDIRNALLGLLIILAAVTVLNEINPNLKKLNFLEGVDPVKIKGSNKTTTTDTPSCVTDPTKLGCTTGATPDQIKKLQQQCKDKGGKLTQDPGGAGLYCDMGKTNPTTNKSWEITDSNIKNFFDKRCPDNSCSVLFVSNPYDNSSEQATYCSDQGGELNSGSYQGGNYNYCVKSN